MNTIFLTRDQLDRLPWPWDEWPAHERQRRFKDRGCDGKIYYCERSDDGSVEYWQIEIIEQDEVLGRLCDA